MVSIRNLLAATDPAALAEAALGKDPQKKCSLHGNISIGAPFGIDSAVSFVH
jgi:hypothetical protein